MSVCFCISRINCDRFLALQLSSRLTRQAVYRQRKLIRLLTTTMLGRGPNAQRRGRVGEGDGGGRRGRRGGAGRRGGRGGGGGGGQRWWDPVWRAERLNQMQKDVEKLDVNEWRQRMEEFRSQDQQEIVIKRNYGREGSDILEDMAQRMGLYFHSYNTGRNRVLVISRVPLPNYRADLDGTHGSSQREIRMSTATEGKLEHLLAHAKVTDVSKIQVKGSSQIQSKQVSSSGFQEYNSDMQYLERLSLDLRCQQQELKASLSAKAMLSFREKLPAYKMKDEILQAVANNQVLVVSGETGCGKTTQLPQFILDDQIDSLNGARCNIICTQPRRISAISVATRVAFERGENLGETVGYQIRLESERSAQTRLLFCTTGVLLRRLVQEPELKGVSHVLVDEIHERGINEDFLIIILRDLLPRRPDLRLVLMSATINADYFSKYFGNASMMHIPGFTFPVKELFLEDVLETTGYAIVSEFGSSQHNSKGRRKQQDQNRDPLTVLFEDVNIESEYKQYSARTKASLDAWDGSQLFGLVEAMIEHICKKEGEGTILVFLTGWDEISKLLEKLQGNHLVGNTDYYFLLPLHGSMSTINQNEIFQRPPPGVRKIILATNIAETSITIDDVVFVIDCGKAKETSYDALNKLACLTPSWISKSSAHQRRGRAGRVQPGICYHLYPKIIYDAMPQYQLPEMLRTPLQELCLQIKSLHFGSISSFLSKALEPPEPLAVQNAIDLLKTIGAMDEREELTSLGRHLSKLPVEPKIGKMLLMGAIFQCLGPALTIASALAYRNPFVLPIDKQEEADKAKRSFAEYSYSDHICLLRAFEAWQFAKRSGQERKFCWENFLSLKTLQMIEDMRNQFSDLLTDIGFIDKSLGPKAYNQYSADTEMISAVLCAGLFPNVVQCKQRGKRSAFFTKEDGKVDLHPSSVNYFVASFPLPYLVYSEKVKTTDIFIRDSTNISDYALVLFGGNLSPSQGAGEIEMLGGYLHFSASKRTIQLVQRLRAELDRLLQRKIDNPGLDISVVGKEIVAAVVELLQSQNGEQCA